MWITLQGRKERKLNPLVERRRWIQHWTAEREREVTNSKPKDSAVGRAADMKSQTVVVSVALLALCCLLIPRGGESAGGIVSLRQTEEERQAGDQLRDESLDDPESEQGLAVDPLGSSDKHKRDTDEAAQTGENRILTIKYRQQ